MLGLTQKEKDDERGGLAGQIKERPNYREQTLAYKIPRGNKTHYQGIQTQGVIKSYERAIKTRGYNKA